MIKVALMAGLQAVDVPRPSVMLAVEIGDLTTFALLGTAILILCLIALTLELYQVRVTILVSSCRPHY